MTDSLYGILERSSGVSIEYRLSLCCLSLAAWGPIHKAWGPIHKGNLQQFVS